MSVPESERNLRYQHNLEATEAPLTAEDEAEYREHAIHGSGAYYDTSDIRRLLATLDAARSDMAALVDENHHLNHERLDAARSVPDNATPDTHLRGDLPPIDLDGIEMRWAAQWSESDDGEVRAWRDDVAALIDEVRRLRDVSNGYFEEMVRRTPGSVPDNAALREFWTERIDGTIDEGLRRVAAIYEAEAPGGWTPKGWGAFSTATLDFFLAHSTAILAAAPASQKEK